MQFHYPIEITGTGIVARLSTGHNLFYPVACKYAKKYPIYKGVCVIDNDEKRTIALSKFEIGDIWGIGEKYEMKLRSKQNVKTLLDFINVPKYLIV